MPICVLVRHGRSSANTEGVLAGWLEGIHLDETGRDQAARLAERLAPVPVREVVTSPLDRCLETAEALLADRDGEPVRRVVEDDLGECRYGAWTGRHLAELAEDPLWRVVQEHPSAARFPDHDRYAAESLAEMSARAVAAVRRHDQRIAEAHGADAIWVAVSHGDVIKAVLADAVGAHIDHFQRVVVEPGSISVIRLTERRPFLLRLNDTGPDLSGLVATGPLSPDAVVGGDPG